MILKYGRELSEKNAGGNPVRDAVITIPSYFTQEQRRMVLDAADLAGISVISLTHENVAAATMFALDTEVAIVRLSALTDDRNSTFEHIEVLAETYDSTLGGGEFDKVIVDILADAFDAMPERKGKVSVRSNDRAMKRLFKESVKVKDILSANKQADVKVPELLD